MSEAGGPGLWQRALALVRRELWPYLVAPPILTAIFVGFEEETTLSMAPHVLRDVAVFVVCLGGPVHATYHFLGDRLGIGSRLRWRDLPLHLAILAAAIFAGTELAFLVLGPFHPDYPFAADERVPSRPAIWLIGLVGNALVTALMFAFSHFRDRLHEMELNALRARHEALAAQVQALQARLQPHFLFNCLNTVASLIEEDPKRAEAVVEKLSDLFRYTLEAGRRESVPLADEIEFVESYLEIEALRLGPRLRAALHVDPAALREEVPPLVLQPAVENAVLHGIAPRREGGRLEIRAERRAQSVALRVEDDGPGPGSSAHRGSGTALADLRRRLQLLHGEAAGLEIGRSASGGFRVEITLPAAPEPRP
jgi:two-component system sensor histidine kinase AlgZ